MIQYHGAAQLARDEEFAATGTVTRECLSCGQPYQTQARRGPARCSQCRAVAQSRVGGMVVDVPRPCKVCGAPTRKVAGRTTHYRRTCSDACYLADKAARRSPGEAWADAQQLAQGGACAICGGVGMQGLVIDHDHATGLCRGMLCGHCNTALGLLCDDPALVEHAALYLRTAGSDAAYPRSRQYNKRRPAREGTPRPQRRGHKGD